MNRISVGLVGCGRWGKLILRDLLSLDIDVTVVARSQPDREYALEQGASKAVGTVADMPEVQGVVVATPTISHADVVKELVPRNIPVFVEKPLTPDPEQAEFLFRAAPDRIFVMDKWRYHPGIAMLADIARREELGAVEGLKTIRVQWGNTHKDVDGIWILAPHDLSICLEILGHIPDARCAVADLSGDRYVWLSAVLGSQPWFHMEVSTCHRQWRREIWLHCADGIALLDDGYSKNLQIMRKDGSTGILQEPELRPISTEMPLWKELKAFVEHLRGGPPPRSSCEEGKLTVDTIAQLRSMAAHKVPVKAT